MITDYFSPEEGVVNSKMKHHRYRYCIITFCDRLFNNQKAKVIGTINTCSTKYKIKEINRDTILFLSPITSALAGGALEELIQKYDPKYIYSFGSCGTFDKSDLNNTLIIPTMAYRDEGFFISLCTTSRFYRMLS